MPQTKSALETLEQGIRENAAIIETSTPDEIIGYLRAGKPHAVAECLGQSALLQESCGNQGRADAIWALCDQIGPAEEERFAAEDQRLEEDAQDRALARWRAGERLATLDLRGACHAAIRASDPAAERQISGQIDAREAKGETG